MVKIPFEYTDTSWLNAQNFAKWVEGGAEKYIVAEANLSFVAANEWWGALLQPATPSSHPFWWEHILPTFFWIHLYNIEQFVSNVSISKTDFTESIKKYIFNFIPINCIPGVC